MAALFAATLSLHPLYLPRTQSNRPRSFITSSSSSAMASPSAAKFDLRTYWTTLIREINQKLDEAIPVSYPEQIYNAMRYSVLADGAKRAPPVMCVAACELFGGNRLAAFPTACALEMEDCVRLVNGLAERKQSACGKRGVDGCAPIYVGTAHGWYICINCPKEVTPKPHEEHMCICTAMKAPAWFARVT